MSANEPQHPNNRERDPRDRPKDKAWFGPKRVGFGWRPQRWQGWLVIVLVVAGMVVFRLSVSGHLFR